MDTVTEVDLLGEALKYFGLLVAAGGGTAAVVFGVFQAWGKGWLDSHFNKRLEEFKHEQAKEIEEFRSKLSTVLDRSSRIHQIEFYILPVLWKYCSSSYQSCRAFCTTIRLNNDIEKIDKKKLSFALLKLGYVEHEIESVIASDNPNAAYERLANLRFRDQAIKAQNEFVDHFQSVLIFLPDEMSSEIDNLLTIMNDAMFEAEARWFENTTKSTEKYDVLENQGREKYLQIKQRITDGIWSLSPKSSPTTQPIP